MNDTRSIQSFLQFVRSTWGAIATFSLILPLINHFARLIELHQDYANLATIIAQITTVFAIFLAFVERDFFDRKNNIAVVMCVIILICYTRYFFLLEKLAIGTYL